MSILQLNETELRFEINKYVSLSFEDYQSPKIDRSKVIHDSVHGTNVFKPHEIAFLDLPIIQKLRRISQTDVASYVYPAGNHNRFEHTVGVTVIAGQIVDALFLKSNVEELLKKHFCNYNGESFKKYLYNHCRIAAILHDCGHGPFSHLSEQVFANQFNNIKNDNNKFGGASPHEILSYYIATSDEMRKFNNDVIKKNYNIDLDLELIGEMIIGYIDKDDKSNMGFAIEIINGSFDADKLDYILRDAHSTGVKIVLDIARLLYTLDILEHNEHSKEVLRLAVNISGVAALEEIIFNKMMLTSTIYHHQKVRAAGCLLKSVFEEYEELNEAYKYLDYTDDRVLNLDNVTDNANIQQHIRMLKARQLPKRAFCFSTRTIESHSKEKFDTIMEETRKVESQKELINEIVNEANRELRNKKITVSDSDVWMDSPKPPKFKEGNDCLIKTDDLSGGSLKLADVFPSDQWSKAFSENKWQGFVFAKPEFCDVISKASKKVFEEVFEVKFKNLSLTLCKIIT